MDPAFYTCHQGDYFTLQVLTMKDGEMEGWQWAEDFYARLPMQQQSSLYKVRGLTLDCKWY